MLRTVHIFYGRTELTLTFIQTRTRTNQTVRIRLSVPNKKILKLTEFSSIKIVLHFHY